MGNSGDTRVLFANEPLQTVKHYREQLDCGRALRSLPASSRIDLASLTVHSLERSAYAAII
jgi:hypothetical protein